MTRTLPSHAWRRQERDCTVWARWSNHSPALMTKEPRPPKVSTAVPPNRSAGTGLIPFCGTGCPPEPVSAYGTVAARALRAASTIDQRMSTVSASGVCRVRISRWGWTRRDGDLHGFSLDVARHRRRQQVPTHTLARVALAAPSSCNRRAMRRSARCGSLTRSVCRNDNGHSGQRTVAPPVLGSLARTRLWSEELCSPRGCRAAARDGDASPDRGAGLGTSFPGYDVSVCIGTTQR